MKTLKNLNGTELHEYTLLAARTEQSATVHLLNCLHEVKTRKAYLDWGFPSLFEYVTKELKYSDGAASERIRAMHLMHQIAEVRTEIESGRLNLTTAARVATHAKRLDLKPEQVVAVVEEMKSKSTPQVEQALKGREEAGGSFVHREWVKPVTAELMELRVVLSPEANTLLEQARDLDANAGAGISEILEKALRVYVKEKQHRKKAELKRSLRAPEVSKGGPSKLIRSRAIPRGVKREIWARDAGRCQYTDPHSGRKCGGTRALTFEHKTPSALGGEHSRENLTLFCAAHNAHVGEKVFGKRGR